MRDWYEEVWAQLPPALAPPQLELRRSFLLGHVRAGQRVLDLGCGDGPFVPALVDARARVTGADVAEGALERARRRAPGARYVRVEAHGPLPFDEGSFDLVWASEVIEHVADTERFIGEVRRVLRPGGTLALTTPYHGRVQAAAIALARFEKHFDPRGQHLRFYTRRSLRELLEQMGFEEVRVRAAPLWWRRLLLGSARR
jgi:SAM-dependent methyltransferase